jgi:hypothetical protein
MPTWVSLGLEAMGLRNKDSTTPAGLGPTLQAQL